MQKLLVFAFLAGLYVQAYSQDLLDLCGLPSCDGKEHIVCQFETQQWAPLCETRESVNMLNLRDVQNDMLTAINSYRNKIAGGLEVNYPKAAHMSTLVWNVTLANIARYNVRQCQSKLDQCRNTPEFNFCGENVGFATFVADTETRSNAQIIMDILESWMDQKQYGNEALVDAFAESPGQKWSAAAQLMRDIPTAIGCGAVSMKRDDTLRTILLTCILNSNIVAGKPVYKQDDVIASGCTTKNPTFTNLCSTSQVFNVNQPELYY